MIKVIHIILTLLIIPITSYSQNYVEAKIVDASNGFNLNKIEISIDGKKTYSDENGNFKYEVIEFPVNFFISDDRFYTKKLLPIVQVSSKSI